MLDKWENELEQYGFLSDDRGGLYSVSTADGCVIARLWEVVSRGSPDRTAIKMGIWVVDPFLDRTDQQLEVAITGFLTESGAEISENALGAWWKPDDEDVVLDTLTRK